MSDTEETNAAVRHCACGCGQTPRSTKAKFMPGHDRRLMGLLVHAIVRNESWNTQDGPGRDPREVATELFSAAGLAKLDGEVAKQREKLAKRSAPAETPELIDALSA